MASVSASAIARFSKATDFDEISASPECGELAHFVQGLSLDDRRRRFAVEHGADGERRVIVLTEQDLRFRLAKLIGRVFRIDLAGFVGRRLGLVGLPRGEVNLGQAANGRARDSD